MRPIVTIAQRELRAYYSSPVGWIVLALFVATTGGFFFWWPMYAAGVGNMRIWFGDTAIILVFLLPALTMRLVAEERQRGTIEVLMTSPVTDTQVIIGKYLGSLLFFGAMLCLTVQFPITLRNVGTPDMGPIYSGYAGLVLLGGTFLALALLVSTTTRSQVVAFVGGMFLLLFLVLLGWVVGQGDEWWQRLLAFIAVPTHMNSFERGLVDTRDVFFYLTVIGGSLFLSVRALSAWKWR